MSPCSGFLHPLSFQVSWGARGLIASVLDLRSSLPCQTLVKNSVLCSWAKHFTLTLALPTRVYKWVNNQNQLIKMLGEGNLHWTDILSTWKYTYLFVVMGTRAARCFYKLGLQTEKRCHPFMHKNVKKKPPSHWLLSTTPQYYWEFMFQSPPCRCLDEALPCQR